LATFTAHQQQQQQQQRQQQRRLHQAATFAVDHYLVL
jgi:hypothetical protein